MPGKDIIELKPEERDNGEIVYETAGGRAYPKESGYDRAFKRVLGVAFTLAGLALALAFFFYIVLPVVLVVLVYVILRKIYLSLVR